MTTQHSRIRGAFCLNPLTELSRRPTLLLAIILVAASLSATASNDQPRPIDLDTPRSFPTITNAHQWQQRAKEIRQQVLVSCGLWPMPEKTPVKAHVFGKIVRDGYSIEKVYFETWPGLYLGGNLYRPLGRGAGPFPAIMSPHGHWANGRMADNKDCSIAGRCINFALQGMVAFSYDMIGYNDTHFADSLSTQSFSDIHHTIATNQTDQLWSISLMGLQTWDSIRALDFLESLPDVDRSRLACTGESGGGTQTFMLGAIDDRLAAQAPVVMVSHTMQGGCLCENAPGLRVEFSNMEIAAAAAARPQILVSASGDWTKDTPTVEGPSIAHIYQLLQHPERISFVRFNFDHNYNQTSREAVYEWFGKWLLRSDDPAALKEKTFKKEPDADLRVFPANQLPEGALTLPQFLQSVRELHRKELRGLVPKDSAGVKQFETVMTPAWRHTLQLDWPNLTSEVHAEKLTLCGDFSTMPVKISRKGQDRALSATYWAPPGILDAKLPRLVVLTSSADDTAVKSSTTTPGPVLPFLKRGLAVLMVNSSGSVSSADPFKNFYSTYNRTELQEHVRDLLTACSAARSLEPRKKLTFKTTLVGSGRAGLCALLAAPGADAVIADCNKLDVSDESALVAPDLFCPGLLAMGGFQAAGMLAAPHPLVLHNTGERFSTDSLRETYLAAGISGKLRVEAGHLTGEDLAEAAAHF